MRRFPCLPFLFSALLTGIVTAVVWHHRGQSLTVSSPPPPAIAAGADPPAVMAVPEAFRDGFDPETEMPLLDALDAESCGTIVRSLLGENIPLIMLRWMELDSTACAAWLYSLPPGPQRQGAAAVILRWWAETDPRAAVQYFITRAGHHPQELITGSQELQEQWLDLATPLLEEDYRKPQDILASVRTVFARNLPEMERNSYLSCLEREWRAAVKSAPGGGQAVELIESIAATPGDPLEEWAKGLKSHLLGTLYREFPLISMAWLEKYPRSWGGYYLLDETFYKLLQGAARAWSPGENPGPAEPWPEPEKAARWFMSIPRPDAERSAIEVLMSLWTQLDLNAASAWLNKQPDSATTDAGRALMAEAAVKEDPRAALAWAQRITDETRRQKSIENVLKLWRSFDPVEATAYAAGRDG